jgi:LuxR family maltose regulon positive regulatory protein
VGAAAIDLFQESFLINPRAIVSPLINDLADLDDEVYLFLENYHWVTNPEIHETLAFFLRHAPSHCHVVLTTRAEPPLPLASLCAQNQLLEIDASVLRFDLEETRNFLEFETPDTIVPSGCINMLQDIARNLAITPETVKSHVNTKLNVEKRAQAVSRAQTLGLAGIHR